MEVMEEIDPFDMDDPELVELSKSASPVPANLRAMFVVNCSVPECKEMDEWYASTEDGKAPRLDDWKPKEKTRVTRKKAHFLLNTVSTVAVSGNYSYGYGPFDYDFTYDMDRNRGSLVPKPRSDGKEPKAPEFARFAHIFFDCIIPNAIIAVDAGYPLTPDDACRALYQGMRTKASKDAISRWELYVREHGGDAWVEAIVKEKFNLYVLGILSDGKTKKRYTVESYVKNHMQKHCNGIVKKLKHFIRYKSPALDKILAVYEKRPEIASWSFRRIHDELGFSNDTITKFSKYLKRSES